MKVRTNGVGVAIAAALTGAMAGAASAQELNIYHQLSETEVIPVRKGFPASRSEGIVPRRHGRNMCCLGRTGSI